MAAISIITISQSSPLDRPTGIADFSRRNSNWVDSVVARGIFQFWSNDNDKTYDKLQRKLIGIDKLLDDGDFQPAFAELRRSSFLLKDLYQGQQRVYKWPGEEEVKISEVDPKTVPFWESYLLEKIHLELQYERYYFIVNPFTSVHKNHLDAAFKTLNRLEEREEAVKKTRESYLKEYILWLRKLVLSYDGSNDYLVRYVNTFASESLKEPDNEHDYWYLKLKKRRIILLQSWGFPVQAYREAEVLIENNNGTFSEMQLTSLMITAARYEAARSRLLRNLLTIDLQKLYNWGQYIEIRQALVRLLFLMGDLPGFVEESTRFKLRLHQLLRERYLTQDAELYVKSVIVDLQCGLYYSYLDYPGIFKNDTSFTQTDFSIESLAATHESLVTRYQILRDRTGFAPVPVSTWEKKLDAVGQQSRIFILNHIIRVYLESQSNLEKTKGLFKKLQKVSSLDSKKIEYIYPLLWQLRIPVKGYQNDDIFDSFHYLYKSRLLTSRVSFKRFGAIHSEINLNKIESELVQSPEGQANPLKLRRALDEVSSLRQWSERISDFQSEKSDKRTRELNILRYIYLYHNSFIFSTMKPTEHYRWFRNFDVKDSYQKASCTQSDVCWLVFPTESGTFSSVYTDSREPVYSFYPGNSLPGAITGFYKEVDDKADKVILDKKLNELASIFKRPLKQVEALSRPGQSLKLILYKDSDLVPFEALPFSPEERLADRLTVKRKLDGDSAPICVGCNKSKSPGIDKKKNSYLVGLGEKRGGIIFGIGSQSDELADIQSIFSHKKIIRESSSYVERFINAFNELGNSVCHVSGEWVPIEAPGLRSSIHLGSDDHQVELQSFSGISNIDSLMVSRQRFSLFTGKKHSHWKQILYTMKLQGISNMVTSIALTPEKFRRAFFYEFYFRTQRKGMSIVDGFRNAFERTKKGFPDYLWPYLLVLYEN